MNKTIKKLIIPAILLLVCIAFMGTNKDKTRTKYNSIDEIISNNEYCIPSIIKTQDDLIIDNTIDNFISIHNSNMVLKIGPYADAKADPLGLYDKSETDNTYTIKNDKIKHFRYRVGYEEYQACTLINWDDETYSYGFMLGHIISEEEALRLLNINRDNIATYTENNNENTTEKIEQTTEQENTHPVVIADKYVIKLPKFNSQLIQRDFEGYTTFSMDDTVVFTFIYNLENKSLFNGQSNKEIDSSIVIYYLTENPFRVGTLAYTDYEIFLKFIKTNEAKDILIFK